MDLQVLWNDKNLSMPLHETCENTCLECLVYGAEGWTLCKTDKAESWQLM